MDDTLFDSEVKRLVEKIRAYFEPHPDLIHFFDPENGGAVRLVTNKSYTSPFLDKSYSTTDKFTYRTAEILQTLNRRGTIANWSLVQIDYLKSAYWRTLLDGPDNLISYASSKINPVTDLVLRALEEAYSLSLRFVFEDDLSAGRPESTFPDPSAARRVALVWKGTPHNYSESQDYGLLIRARSNPESNKCWWIVAGCGRPGSVAAQRFLFEPEWSKMLWGRFTPGPPNSFVAVFRVSYEKKASDNPLVPELLEVQRL